MKSHKKSFGWQVVTLWNHPTPSLYHCSLHWQYQIGLQVGRDCNHLVCLERFGTRWTHLASRFFIDSLHHNGFGYPPYHAVQQFERNAAQSNWTGIPNLTLNLSSVQPTMSTITVALLINGTSLFEVGATPYWLPPPPPPHFWTCFLLINTTWTSCHRPCMHASFKCWHLRHSHQ